MSWVHFPSIYGGSGLASFFFLTFLQLSNIHVVVQGSCCDTVVDEPGAELHGGKWWPGVGVEGDLIKGLTACIMYF